MTWYRYSAEVPEAAYAAYREALAQLLGLDLGALEQGVTEHEMTDGFVTLASDPESQFLAARSLRNGRCLESYFVRPRTKPARVGLSLLSDHDQPSIPDELQPWLHPLEHKISALPSFTTLAGLVLSRGATAHEVGARERRLDAEVDYLKRLIGEQSDALRRVKAELRGARASLSQPEQADNEKTPAEEFSLEALADWCATNEDRLIVLPRARNGAKKSRYDDPALIGAALELLAGPYRDLKRGRISKDVFESSLYATGLRMEGSVAPNVAGEQGEAYFVSWAGRRRFLESHLLKGGGRDERYCFRLYFFWDTESERAVVGSMPAHLTNSLS